MRALFFDRKGLRCKPDYPVPRRGRDEALIKVTCAGICNTDIEITKGYYRFRGIPGHEFVGIVEECGHKSLIGKRVAGEINVSCGSCYYCKNKMQNHCPNRSVIGILNRDGVFAEYVTLPVKNLHKVPDSVSDEEAVFIEPLAAAFEITRQVDIMPSDKVCVLGDGKLGLLVAQVLFLTGCKLMVVGKHKEKLSILGNKGIRTQFISDFGEKEFDIVVDCTGSPSGIETALNIVRPAGKVVIKTTVARQKAFDLNRIVVNELTLIGSRCGPFAEAIRALEKKKIEVTQLISRFFPLEDGLKAFKYASRKGVLKVILGIG